ncbi:cytochrome P450, partial [Ganoderma leucocontextum]
LSVLILGRMDTTSNVLTRTFQLLAQDPAVQEKLRAEIVEAHNSEATMDYDALNKLPYLEAVCRETLRLYPPAQVIPRRATKDVLLPLSAAICGRNGTPMNEVLVPRGTYVMIDIQASNDNKAVWGEDAYEWKPERWLGRLPGAVDEARIPSIFSSILSFLGRPRACIGFKFAQLEMKVIVAVMLMAFSFDLTDTEITWKVGAISFPTMGLGSTKPELLLRMKRLGL